MDDTDYASDNDQLRPTAQCCFYIESLSLVWATEIDPGVDPIEPFTTTAESAEEQQQVEEELEYLNSWERMLEFI